MTASAQSAASGYPDDPWDDDEVSMTAARDLDKTAGRGRHTKEQRPRHRDEEADAAAEEDDDEQAEEEDGQAAAPAAADDDDDMVIFSDDDDDDDVIEISDDEA